MDLKWTDDKAQVAGIVIFVTTFCVVALFLIILGPIMQEATDVHNRMVLEGYAVTDERAEVMVMLQTAFTWGAPLITVLFLFVWVVLNALRERTGSI